MILYITNDGYFIYNEVVLKKKTIENQYSK